MCESKQCIHQHASQPNLTWDSGNIGLLLSGVHLNLDRLLEQSKGCDISKMGEVSTWERTLPEGIDNHEHGNSEGVAEMMADAMRCRDQLLTKQMLFDWHYRLFFYDFTRICKFPIGEWRGVEEGPIYFNGTGFVAPAADRIEEEMDKFLSWFNEESRRIDP